MSLMPTSLMEIVIVLAILVMVATFFYGLGKAHKVEPNAKKECGYCGGVGLLGKGVIHVEVCPHCRGRGVWTDTQEKLKEGKKC